MDLSPAQLISSMVASAAGGGGTSAFFTWLGKRSQGRAYTMGAVDHAVDTAMKSVTGQLERTEKRLQSVEDQHADCETNLREVNRKLDASLSEIDRLMKGPVAKFGDPPP